MKVRTSMQSAIGRRPGASPAGALAASMASLAIMALAPAPAALGQSAQIPAAPQSRPVAIVGATIHPVSGPPIADGHVIFDEGVIVAVGEGDALPLGALFGARAAEVERIDARGMHLWPGLVAAHTTVGLVETLAVPVTDDRTEFGSVRPEVRAAVAVNPDSDLIPVARSAGILTLGVFPQGGLVAGRPSVLRADGWTWESMAIAPAHGQFIVWPLTEPVHAPWAQRSPEDQMKRIAEEFATIERLFDEATAWVAAREADPQTPPDLRWEAMAPVLSGREPLYVLAHRAGQIESAVAFALRRGLRPVIVGGSEADEVVDLLREHDIPVIVTGTHRLPLRRHDDWDRPFALPAKLHAAGVRFALASGEEPAHERNLAHQAGTAVAHGLPRDAAIASITAWAAELIGIGATHGTIEPGKRATFFLADGPDLGHGPGDPLEITTVVLDAWIDGRRVDLGNRHERLYDKYREKYRQLGRWRD